MAGEGTLRLGNRDVALSATTLVGRPARHRPGHHAQGPQPADLRVGPLRAAVHALIRLRRLVGGRRWALIALPGGDDHRRTASPALAPASARVALVPLDDRPRVPAAAGDAGRGRRHRGPHAAARRPGPFAQDRRRRRHRAMARRPRPLHPRRRRRLHRHAGVRRPGRIARAARLRGRRATAARRAWTAQAAAAGSAASTRSARSCECRRAPRPTPTPGARPAPATSRSIFR